MFDVTSSNKSTIETPTRSMSQIPINEKRRNYRFYAGDPAIHPAEKRLYANGDFEGTPLHVSGGTDPRNPNRLDRSYQDLPVPKFKLDRCWVGAIPAKEVTFRNLNDNITKTFLTDMCKRFGDIDDCKIYYDRQTKKHLGLGTVIFKTTKAARECVNALNMTTKMGSMISVSLETSGQERTKQYATIVRAQEQEKAAQEKALAASAAASPPPSIDLTSNRQLEKSHISMQLPVNHKLTNNSSQSSNSYASRDHHRPSKFQSTSTRFDSRSHRSGNDNPEQFSFDPYGSFGNNSNNYKSSSRRSHHRSHHRRPHSQQRRRRRKTSSSATSSASSRSSSSSTSSTASSTSRSHSRSSSSSSRSSYSSTQSRNEKLTNNSRTNNSKQLKDDEDHRPSLDERIAALFQQQQQQTTHPSSMPTKTYHRPLPLPNIHPPTSFPYPPPPPPLSTPMTNIVGSHHHHQQSYGVVNNFNFFGNSFPPASFLNSTGGTNWQDMFKQPPPSSSATMSTNVTMTNQSYTSSNGFQPHPTDGVDERERKTNHLTNAVNNIVTGELIEILRKDLAKKLIETLVYKSIETWYDIEERKDKIKKIKSAESSINDQSTTNEQSSTQLHHSISNPSLERIPDDISGPIAPMTAPPFSSSTSSTNLATYFEQMKDSAGSSVRSQMPKIPSFKKRTIPDEKPVIPQKSVASNEKKEPRQQHHQSRKTSRKRLSSSSSESNETPENDDSQSRDSVSMLAEDTSLSETKPVSRIPVEPSTPEEEEDGEIKDDDHDEEEIKENNISNQVNTEPTPLPSSPVIKPPSTPPPKKSKTIVKQPKKSGAPKKRKIDHVKSEPIQDQDEVDNSTLAKRKKSVQSHQHVTSNNQADNQSIQTFNLLDSLPEQKVQSSPKSSYNPFAYIEFEHDYAFMTKQPVLVAKRLTVDGLNDMGVQAPVMIPIKLKFSPREHDAEMRIMYDLDHGVDEEDMLYLKQSFQRLSEEGHSCTTKTRWVDHPPSRDSSFIKQPSQPHRTGCARTEGYYKIIKDEKISPVKTTDSSQSTSILPQAMLDTNRTTTGAQMSRELRSEHRRNLLALGDAEFADHFKFSQLKLRKKRLRYAKSGIHAWGLFACEPIAMEDMVIEYVGETIRQSVGDLREKHYELEGMNSNYMFRVDSDTIVDATKCGNLARFINHSCDPNCYAKIIPVESQKKIVIYSKRDIRLGEEITYDYKFPLEEQKIPCRCGTPVCRGSLN
ncbi:hypothetical protein I4U23_019152 [Adineta vaga]|nr:hypothetical protein I4U23_019152 [Adineta vaga]